MSKREIKLGAKMTAIKKQLSLLLITIILLLAGLHKLNGTIPPDWFIGKFEKTFIGQIPGGLSISYWIIVLLELIGPILFGFAWVQMIRKKNYNRILSLGFLMCYILFIILTFGSFLVQDYDNGFMDFIYFVGILFIEHTFFKEVDVRPGETDT